MGSGIGDRIRRRADLEDGGSCPAVRVRTRTPRAARRPGRVARTGQTMVRADTSGNAACSIDPATVQQGW